MGTHFVLTNICQTQNGLNSKYEDNRRQIWNNYKLTVFWNEKLDKK